MKRLMPYLRPYRRECVLAPLFKMTEAVFELLVPLVVAVIIDRGIPSGDRGLILRMGGVLVALGAGGMLLAFTAQWFSAKAACGFAASVRRALFSHIQSLDWTELDAEGTATLITRLTSDINQLQSGLNLFLRLFLRSPFVVAGAVVMAFVVDARTALVFCVTVPLLALVVAAVMRVTTPMYRGVQKRLDGVLAAVRENITGARVIRAFGREDDEQRRFDEQNESLTASQLAVGRISALMNPVTYVIINLAVIAVLYTGGRRVDAGALSQGEVVALVNYMSQILVELIKFANLVVSITKALASAGRVESVLARKAGMAFPETSAHPDASAPAVEFDDVSLRYAGAGAPSLEHVSFTLARGGTLGVIGGTGSGKSSLVNLIPRFYDATSGRVRLEGNDVSAYTKDTLRAMVAVVPQKAQLFTGTIRSNLQMGAPDADDASLWEALRAAQAEDFVRRKPGGLDEPVSAGGKNFSGGQRQRLTIARALAAKPDILILDDSASALDFATDAALRRALRELPFAPAVVIVSQRASSLMHADTIVVLDDGRVAGEGTHEELLRTCPVYEEIYQSQFKTAKERGGEAK